MNRLSIQMNLTLCLRQTVCYHHVYVNIWFNAIMNLCLMPRQKLQNFSFDRLSLNICCVRKQTFVIGKNDDEVKIEKWS